MEGVGSSVWGLGVCLAADFVPHNFADVDSRQAFHLIQGLGFGVWGLGFRIWGLGFGV